VKAAAGIEPRRSRRSTEPEAPQVTPPGAYEFGIDRRLEAENAPILTAVGKVGDAIASLSRSSMRGSEQLRIA
jgi:hypothetical protein